MQKQPSIASNPPPHIEYPLRSPRGEHPAVPTNLQLAHTSSPRDPGLLGVTPEPKQSYEDETTRTVEHLHQRLSEAEDALLVMKWQSQQQASDREALTQAFNQVSDEKVQLQDQHKTLTLSLQDATAAVYEKDEAIALLQESLEASDAARHELSEEVTQQAKTITELREKLQAQISEFEGVQERSSKQDRTEVVQLQAEIHDLRRKMAHQTGEIEGLRDMVAAGDSKAASLQKSLDGAYASVKALKRNLQDESHERFVSSLQSEASAGRLRELSLLLEERNTSVSSIKTDLDRLGTAEAKASAMEAKVMSLDTNIFLLQQELAAAKARAEDVTAERLISEINMLKETNSVLVDKVKQLEEHGVGEAAHEVQLKAAERSPLQKDKVISSASEVKVQLKAENDFIQERALEQEQVYKESLAAKEKEIVTILQANTNLSAQLDELRSELKSSAKMARSHGGAISEDDPLSKASEFDATPDERDFVISKLKGDLEDLRTRVSHENLDQAADICDMDLAIEIEQLTKDQEILKAEIVSHKDGWRALRSVIKGQGEEIAKTAHCAADGQPLVEVVRSLLDSIDAELGSLSINESEFSKLKDQISKMEIQLSESSLLIADLEQKGEKVALEKATALAHEEELAEELKGAREWEQKALELRGQMSELNEKVKELARTVGERDRALELRVAAAKAHEMVVRDMQQQLDDLTEELVALRVWEDRALILREENEDLIAKLAYYERNAFERLKEQVSPLGGWPGGLQEQLEDMVLRMTKRLYELDDRLRMHIVQNAMTGIVDGVIRNVSFFSRGHSEGLQDLAKQPGPFIEGRVELQSKNEAKNYARENQMLRDALEASETKNRAMEDQQPKRDAALGTTCDEKDQGGELELRGREDRLATENARLESLNGTMNEELRLARNKLEGLEQLIQRLKSDRESTSKQLEDLKPELSTALQWENKAAKLQQQVEERSSELENQRQARMVAEARALEAERTMERLLADGKDTAVPGPPADAKDLFAKQLSVELVSARSGPEVSGAALAQSETGIAPVEAEIARLDSGAGEGNLVAASEDRAVLDGMGSIRASFEMDMDVSDGQHGSTETSMVNMENQHGKSVGLGPIFAGRASSMEASPIGSEGGDEIRGRGRPDRASFSRRRLQDRRRSAREVVQQEEKDAGEYHTDAAAEQPVEEMIDGDSGPAANQAANAARARIKALMSKARSRAW